MFIGVVDIGGLLTFSVNTHSPTTQAEIDADAVPSYRIYEDETGTPILTGVMAKLDDAGTTGFYSEQITVSAISGFEYNKTYTIRVTATVAGIVGTTIRTFQVKPLDTYLSDWNTGVLTIAQVTNVAVVGSLGAGSIVSSSFGPASIEGVAFATGLNIIPMASSTSNTGAPSNNQGPVQGSTATTVTLGSGASAVNNFYVGAQIRILAGTGAGGQSRLCTAYDGVTKIATVATAWATNPPVGSHYAIEPGGVAAAAVGSDPLQGIIEGTVTLKQALQYILAFVSGKTDGGGSDTLTFRNISDTQTALQFVLSAQNNRLTVTRTPTP